MSEEKVYIGLKNGQELVLKNIDRAQLVEAIRRGCVYYTPAPDVFIDLREVVYVVPQE